MKTYLRILSFARPLKLLLPLYVVLTFLAIIFNMANFASLIPILQVIFGAVDDTIPSVDALSFPDFSLSFDYFSALIDYGQAYLTSGQTDKLVLLQRICVSLVVSVFLANFFSYTSQIVLAIIKKRVILNVRGSLYQSLVKMHLSYFTNERKGDMMSRMTNDIQEIESTAVNAFNVLIKEPLTVIVIFITLFSIHAHLTLFTFLILPVSGVIIGELTRRLRKKARQGQHSLGMLLGIIDETLSGQRVIKAFNAGRFVLSKFGKLNQRYGKILYSMEVKRSLASPLSQFLGVTAVAIILYKAGTLVLTDDPTLNLKPQFFLFYILMYGQVIAPLKSLANAFSNIQRGLICSQRVFEIVDQEPAIQSKENAVQLEGFNDRIRFEGVKFKYDQKWVLDGIDLEVNKGQTVALVGPSGGGKSTLVDLVPRFHDVVEGGVLIDGVDIRDANLESVRAQMGVVTQESILFNDTVHNNIAFGIRASREEVIAAARIANAHEFIENLEEGYETEIGDRGGKLSGGQRQRLTIARAILKNPPILLLDEATSALDSESEHLVQEALTNLMKNRTSIVIAHRLSTIQHADKIVVLQEGHIVEQGTHDELMAKPEGLYHRLSDMQATH